MNNQTFSSQLSKAVLVLALTYSTVAFGQKPEDCSKLILQKTDSAGNQTTAAHDVVFISDDDKTGLSVYCFLNRSHKVLVVSIQAIGAGECVDKGDRVEFLFANGEALELNNTNDFNCDGSSTLYFGGGLGKKNELNTLASTPIKTMRVWTRDDYVQKELPPSQAEELMKIFRCLMSKML